ncbi:MAG: hypothetical protein J1G06_01180 [Oscillospiraceae bacterium]|nr:hypothetical protein [Oscillospiraceae bacterium]
MNTIKGTNLITINAQARETYCIQYESGYSVNILNQTDGIISVAPKASYAENDTSSECMKLTEDAFYYDFCSRLDKNLYITSGGDGYISVIRTDR